MSVERLRVLYRGRVQGVGFRYTAQRLAQSLAVAGYVRNLDDGGVELVAEAEPHEIRTFLDAISQAMGSKIHHAQVEIEPPGDERLTGFSIRY
jgi:acylphosphatase